MVHSRTVTRLKEVEMQLDALCPEVMDMIVVPNTPPNAGKITGECQSGTSISLAIRTPERLRRPPDLVP
jgi:hypothetical protein